MRYSVPSVSKAILNGLESVSTTGYGQKVVTLLFWDLRFTAREALKNLESPGVENK